MNQFSAMVDVCFKSLGTDAVYTPIDGRPAYTVRAIIKRLDAVAHVGAAQIIASASGIDVRMSEVSMPQVGDRITIGVTNYVVASDPLRDTERLVWTLSASPPALWDPSSGLAPGPVEGGSF